MKQRLIKKQRTLSSQASLHRIIVTALLDAVRKSPQDGYTLDGAFDRAKNVFMRGGFGSSNKKRVARKFYVSTRHHEFRQMIMDCA